LWLRRFYVSRFWFHVSMASPFLCFTFLVSRFYGFAVSMFHVSVFHVPGSMFNVQCGDAPWHVAMRAASPQIVHYPL
ncbi:MAG: hypothetical protein J6W06_02395, partial [Bacteroidales bacterium]|nr:hypothetical protein [Bacteroidales bacterium]